MNWAASLAGAVLVAAVGLVVGHAVGGKTTTKIRTVTVVKRVTAPRQSHSAVTTASTTSTTQMTSSMTSTTTPSTTSTARPSPPVQEEFLSAYIESEGGSEALDRDGDGVYLDDEPSEQELAGRTYQHAVAFDLESRERGGTVSYQIPTPGFSTFASSAVGLDITSSASMGYRLTVYKNDDDSPSSVILYRASFHGPSTVHEMDFSTEGATDLLFVWTKLTPGPGEEDVFILADPVLSGGR